MRFAPGVKIKGIHPELAAVIPAIGNLIGVHSVIRHIQPNGSAFFIDVRKEYQDIIIQDLKTLLPEDIIIEPSQFGVVVKAPKPTQASGEMAILSEEETPQSFQGVKPDKPWPRSTSEKIEVFHPLHRAFRVTVLENYHDVRNGSRPVIREESRNYYRGLLPEAGGTSEVTIPKSFCAFWKWEDEI